MSKKVIVTVNTPPPVEPTVTITMTLAQAKAVKGFLGTNNSCTSGFNTIDVYSALWKALKEAE